MQGLFSIEVLTHNYVPAEAAVQIGKLLIAFSDITVCLHKESSVSIVSGYWLDDRAIEVRSPAEAKGVILYPLSPDRRIFLN
jgi:hypothetical protein